MKFIKCVPIFVAVLLILATSSMAQTVIISDQFDDGNLATNTGGVGTGWDTGFASVPPPIEANGVFTCPEVPPTGGNNADGITSKDTVVANGSQPLTTVFKVNELTRTTSIDGQTARFFVGLVEYVADAVDPSNAADHPGLMVVLHCRYDDTYLDALGAQQIGDYQGALMYTSSTFTQTLIEKWDWDPSVILFDTASGFPAHRQAKNLVADDLVVTLTTDATGYSLSFSSSTPAAVMPAPMSGTWAAKGVTNELDAARAAIYTRGWYQQLVVDSVLIQAAAGGEGEGEGEGQGQGGTISSNVYPPFIDEGTVVILTAPAGTGHQWEKDGADIAGETNTTLVFNPVTLADEGSYTVTYDNGAKVIVTSPPFILLVSPEGSVPVSGWLGTVLIAAALLFLGTFTVCRRKSAAAKP